MNAQAGLHFRCLHATKLGFLVMRLINLCSVSASLKCLGVIDEALFENLATIDNFIQSNFNAM